MAEMSERGEYEQPVSAPGDDVTSSDEGFLHLTSKDEQNTTTQPEQTPLKPDSDTTITTLSIRDDERAGTTEHLAAQRAFPPLDTHTPEMKAQFATLRTEMTRLLTDLRWEGYSIDETAQRLVTLLNVGPVVQWQSVLVPFLYEIDRAGALIPAWLSLIAQDDLADLPPATNPAETPLGRARRYAILLLGKYRTMGIRDDNQTTNLPAYLGKLASDPNVSMYATEALVQQGTVPAMQALIEALKVARSWAKVDVIEGCLALNQERFFTLVVNSGLKHAPGLESYIALPIYRAVPLERYFVAELKIPPQLQENAALIVQRVLRESMTPPTSQGPLPPLFTRPFPAIVQALFTAAQRNPTWSYAVTLHTLGLLMGNYWSAISKQTPLAEQIVTQIYQVLPLMNEIERWMASPGRDILLQTVRDPQEANLSLIAQTLGELRDPRATAAIIDYLEHTTILADRTQALTLSALCSALSSIGDSRAALPMLQMVKRTVDIAGRSQFPKRSDNLSYGDPAVPGSIVYAAAIRATGQLGATQALEDIWHATDDFDPYVRTRALDALTQLDPQGESAQSRSVVRTALTDPRANIVRQATQLIIRYHDLEAVPLLRQSQETRPELRTHIQETLQALAQ
jgi:FOG: HEAT repeat